jgi:hypothetical protein
LGTDDLGEKCLDHLRASGLDRYRTIVADSGEKQCVAPRGGSSHSYVVSAFRRTKSRSG